MSGVKKFACFGSFYSFDHKSYKWDERIIINFLEISLNDALIIFNFKNPKISEIKFRKILIGQLRTSHNIEQAKMKIEIDLSIQNSI